jgi:Zn-dependent protease
MAEYHGSSTLPIISILMALAGWIILAPGAVYITGVYRPLTRKASGLISLAGPATNLVLSVLFYVISLADIPLLEVIGSFGYEINIWLALFNMVPALGFDGQKIWAWNKAVYLVFAAFAAILFFTL